MKIFETQFTTLNDMIIGLPSGTPIGIMGPAAEGKSILAEELAFKFASDNKGNILIINTEKPNSMLYQLWETKFKKKYSEDVKLYVEEALTVDDMLKLNGFDMTVTLSSVTSGKKAKKVPILSGINVENSKVKKYIRDKNVKVVVYDSLTTPFNSVLIGGQQNTPARYEVEETFFQSLRQVFYKEDCAIITINHVTYNPQQPFLTREAYEIKGGKAVFHSHEYVFYIEQGRSRYTLNKRTLYIVRHPILREWSHSVDLWLDDDGYRELTAEELAKLKEQMIKEIKGEK